MSRAWRVTSQIDTLLDAVINRLIDSSNFSILLIIAVNQINGSLIPFFFFFFFFKTLY